MQKSVWSRRQYLKSCLGIWGYLTFAPSGRAQEQRTPVVEAIPRQIRFTISLSNPYPYELQDQKLWVYMPVNETGTQKLNSLKVSIPYELLTDRLEQSVLQLSLPYIAPLASKVVSVIADLTLQNKSAQTLLVSRQDWLLSERYVEITAPDIQFLAKQLKRSTEQDTAQAIYNWIRQNLQYAGYVADDRGALDALKNKSGDCTEYAYLATALARINGIPARMVGGYVVDRNSAPRAEDYHNWTEMYFQGAWHLVDAQKENWLSPTEQYIAFRFYKDEEINPIGLAHRFKISGQLVVAL